jgi:predicted MFS family arabinose efflux permease
MSTANSVDPATLQKSAFFDRSVGAAMLAGGCTFLNVYATQPLLPVLRQEFHGTEFQVSLTISAATLAVAIIGPFIGWAAEAIGRKRVIVPALFALVVPTALAATSESLNQLIFWRFLQGICVPGISVVMVAYINEEWAGRRLGSAITAYMSGTILGGFLGRLIAGLTAEHMNWRISFVFLGIITLLGAIGVLRWLPKAKNFSRANLHRATEEAFRHLRNPRLLANFVMGFMILFVLIGAFTYVNFYLAASPFNLSPALLGAIFTVYLVGAVATPLSGVLLDRSGVIPTLILALALSVVGLLLTLLPALTAVLVGLALFSSGAFISQSAASIQTGALAGRARSSAAGLYVTAYYAGGSLGAMAPAWTWNHYRWPGCVALLIVASVLGLGFGLMAEKPLLAASS